MAGVTVPVIPFAHQYLVTEPIAGVTPDLPQLRDPDNLVYFRPEVAGLVMGGYERNPAPWGLDGIPADFNGKLLPPDWPRFEEISRGAQRRVPAMADAGVRQVINGPEGFTPDNEFILGPVRGPRLLRRRRLLGPRHRRRRRHGPPGGALDRGRRAGVRPVEDGYPPLRGARTGRATTPWPARPRTTPPTTTSITRSRSDSPAGRCTCRRPTSGCASSERRSARRPAGSGRTGSSPTPRPGTSRSGRGAGPGSTGPRPSEPRRWPPARQPPSTTRRASPRSRSAGRARSRSSSGCARTTSIGAVGRITYTSMLNQPGRDRVRLHRDPPRGGSVPHRHRHRVRHP